MSKLQLLSPAGSFEGVTAAVQNGADAVYLGLGDFNARRGAKNLTGDELAHAVKYCHLRGAQVYVTLNTLVTDRELPALEKSIRVISDSGADAVIVQDLGVARMVRGVAPGLLIHASTQMTINTLDGVKQAAELGFCRVVLARELSRGQLQYICAHSPIETEVFVHGSMCVCYSGQCYMSAVIGKRSGNRGMCAQPCRMAYSFAGSSGGYPLSLRDMSLSQHLGELSDMGVHCLKIEGRMKRAEYTAIVTDTYAQAIASGKPPTAEELRLMKLVFSRQGFTDGYYAGKRGPEMFGVREEASDAETAKLFQSARASYRQGVERQRVGLSLSFIAVDRSPMRLIVTDPEGRAVSVAGPPPAYAINRESTTADIKAQLVKTGGTPYYCDAASVKLDRGLAIPVSELNAMRRDALEKLSAVRTKQPRRRLGEYREGFRYLERKTPPDMIVELSSLSQLTPELMALSPKWLYLPIEELVRADGDAAKLDGLRGVELAAVAPRIANDEEWAALRPALAALKERGVNHLVVGNLGQLAAAQELDFSVRGDYSLNITNSLALRAYKKLGLSSATLSFELNFAQVRDISKAVDTEIIVYGRLPLMITENCLIKNRTGKHDCDNLNELCDRTGALFPVVRAHGCRNQILNSQKLFLGDKRADYMKLGLSAVRLRFTTENPRECVLVSSRYMGLGRYEVPACTRGLYYRGVE